MSVGVWKPGGDAESRVVDPALLSRFSELANGLAGVCGCRYAGYRWTWLMKTGS